jgi:hypothetical protein
LTWVKTLKGFIEAGSKRRAKAIEAVQDYRPLTLAEHVVRAAAFIQSISQKHAVA